MSILQAPAASQGAEAAAAAMAAATERKLLGRRKGSTSDTLAAANIVTPMAAGGAAAAAAAQAAAAAAAATAQSHNQTTGSSAVSSPQCWFLYILHLVLFPIYDMFNLFLSFLLQLPTAKAGIPKRRGRPPNKPQIPNKPQSGVEGLQVPKASRVESKDAVYHDSDAEGSDQARQEVGTKSLRKTSQLDSQLRSALPLFVSSVISRSSPWLPCFHSLPKSQSAFSRFSY